VCLFGAADGPLLDGRREGVAVPGGVEVSGDVGLNAGELTAAGNTVRRHCPSCSHFCPCLTNKLIFMLLTMPPPFAASALVAGTLGPSYPGIKPAWLGAGVLVPEPGPVPLLDEYKDSPTLGRPGLRMTEDRFNENGESLPNIFNALNALVTELPLAVVSAMEDGGLDDAL